ncbi:barnase inhibitor [Micromonospora sp. NPDC048947]|uniref:barnase inhibitor n=1 Tax=Micromonospora sp. NPDC048947 TaxID=3154826 RepID=UPI0033FFD410
MTTGGDALPVLVIDGANFSDLDGFAREFSSLLCHYAWNGNLDAFNDILRGGFGTPEAGWVFRWINSDLSRAALSHHATIRWLEQILCTCHPSNRASVRARISDAQQGRGPTLFDMLVEIVRAHGAGGEEFEDGVVLELM